MPAPVVLVHSDPEYLAQAAEGLRVAGLAVAAFSNSMAALDALERAETSEVLVTLLSPPEGMPNGLSLALVAKRKRPRLKVLFLAEPNMVRYVEQQPGDGHLPTTAPAVDTMVLAIEDMMRAG